MDDKWLRWRTRRKTPANAVEVSAQALYDALVKDTLSPAFRALGFKGSGGRYSMPGSDCWALLGLQKSAYSDAAEVQFTINLLVVNKSGTPDGHHSLRGTCLAGAHRQTHARRGGQVVARAFASGHG
jgi:hypothetical protein